MAVAFFARDAAMPPGALENIDASLESLADVAPEERTGGMNSYNPDLEIPGWGEAELPDLAKMYGSADGSVPPQAATMGNEDPSGLSDVLSDMWMPPGPVPPE